MPTRYGTTDGNVEGSLDFDGTGDGIGNGSLDSDGIDKGNNFDRSLDTDGADDGSLHLGGIVAARWQRGKLA
jgi:hypothetical protein